ncbi:zinc finger, CCHC-type containing protein [Tanacetum coccineum]
MASAAMKHMASNFAKLDKFEGMDFRIWQKKMHFLLSSISVVYVLTTPILEDGLILNGMSDPLFDIYQNVEFSKELWDSLEAKYMAKDASSKKFLVHNFTNFKMTDSRSGMKQYNELLGILRRFTQHKIKMNESIQVTCIIDKLALSWKDFKHTLKNLKDELTLVELGSHLRIKESLRVQDSDKSKGNNVASLSVVNMVEHNNSSRYNDNKGRKVSNKANGSDTNGSVDGSTNSLKGETVHVCKDRCWFKTYESLNDGTILHIGNESIALVHRRVPRPSLRILNRTKDIGGSVVSEKVTEQVVQQPELRKCKRNRTPKNFRPEFQLYLIKETRDDVFNQNSYCFNIKDDPKTFDEAIKSQDVTFWKEAINDEIPSLATTLGCWLIYLQNIRVILFSINSDDGNPSRAIIKQALRTTKTIRLLIAMTSIHNLVIHQMDVKTAFLNGELEEEVYMNQPQGFIMPGNENKVDQTKEFLSSRFPMKDMGEADVIMGIRIKHESNGIAISWSYYIENVLKKFNYFNCTPMSTLLDTSEKLMPNNGQAVSQLEYSRVIGCLMYAMTCTKLDIAFAVGKLGR